MTKHEILMEGLDGGLTAKELRIINDLLTRHPPTEEKKPVIHMDLLELLKIAGLAK